MASETSSLLGERIKLSSNEAELVEDLLEQWRNRQILSPATCAQLRRTVEVLDPFDWNRLAKYTFRLALVCLIIAVFSLLFDSAFLQLIRKVLEINPYVRAAITTAVSMAIHYRAYKRSHKLPTEVWMNEAIHAVGAIVLCLAAMQLAEAVHGWGMYHGTINVKARRVLWLLACCYALIGIATMSGFIWGCGMFTMGVWTFFWIPKSGSLDILRAEYPVRFVILGGILITTAYCMRLHPRTSPLWPATRIWGLIYALFFGLWFGSATNTLDMHWQNPRLWPAIGWALGLTVGAGLTTWHGLKYDDATTRAFGLVFLALDVYTRYWDFFWRSMYRPLFFAILAASFAMVGWVAERMRRAKAESLPA